MHPDRRRIQESEPVDQILKQYFALAQRINRSTNPGVVQNAIDRMRDIALSGHPILSRYAARYLSHSPGKSAGNN